MARQPRASEAILHARFGSAEQEGLQEKAKSPGPGLQRVRSPRTQACTARTGRGGLAWLGAARARRRTRTTLTSATACEAPFPFAPSHRSLDQHVLQGVS